MIEIFKSFCNYKLEINTWHVRGGDAETRPSKLTDEEIYLRIAKQSECLCPTQAQEAKFWRENAQESVSKYSLWSLPVLVFKKLLLV